MKQQCDRGLSLSWLTTQPISVIIQRSFYAFINVYTYDESKYWKYWKPSQFILCICHFFFFTRITITFILNLYILIKQAFYWVLNQSWTIKRHAYLMTNTFTGSTVIRKKNQGKENSVEKWNRPLVFNALEVGHYENVGGFVTNMCISDDTY